MCLDRYVNSTPALIMHMLYSIFFVQFYNVNNLWFNIMFKFVYRLWFAYIMLTVIYHDTLYIYRMRYDVYYFMFTGHSAEVWFKRSSHILFMFTGHSAQVWFKRSSHILCWCLQDIQQKYDLNGPLIYYSCLQDIQQKYDLNGPLASYLIKPVQRITKYQLLLKDLLSCCEEGQGEIKVSGQGSQWRGQGSMSWVILGRIMVSGGQFKNFSKWGEVTMNEVGVQCQMWCRGYYALVY